MDQYTTTKLHLKRIGVPPGNWNNNVVVKEALDRGIQVKGRQKRPGVMLVHGNRRFTWHLASTDLNTRLANRVANYKDVTSRLLRTRGVSVPENAVFQASDADRAWRWAEPILPVVLKPIDSLRGTNVHVNISTYSDFQKAFGEVSKEGKPVLVEQFHPGVERRCLVVDNELVAVAERRPANVVGDGQSSIRELVAAKNQNRGRFHKPLALDEVGMQKLSEQGLTPESFPASGQLVYVRSNLNIHSGGDVIDWTEDVSDDERNYVEAATREIPGLRLAGLDVMFSRNGDGKQPAMIEINHNPLVSMHHFPLEGEPRNVAGAIIDAMFPGTKA